MTGVAIGPAFRDAEIQAEPASRRATLAVVGAPGPGMRARSLMNDARVASLDHLALVRAGMDGLRDLLGAVADDGELYGAGLRDLAARLSEDLFWKAKSMDSLIARQAGRSRT